MKPFLARQRSEVKAVPQSTSGAALRRPLLDAAPLVSKTDSLRKLEKGSRGLTSGKAPTSTAFPSRFAARSMPTTRSVRTIASAATVGPTRLPPFNGCTHELRPPWFGWNYVSGRGMIAC